MENIVTLSTLVSSKVKKAATEFCRRRGLKLRYLVEEALLEQLEDEMDLEIYRERRHEERISLEKVVTGRKTKK